MTNPCALALISCHEERLGRSILTRYKDPGRGRDARGGTQSGQVIDDQFPPVRVDNSFILKVLEIAAQDFPHCAKARSQLFLTNRHVDLGAAADFEHFDKPSGQPLTDAREPENIYQRHRLANAPGGRSAAGIGPSQDLPCKSEERRRGQSCTHRTGRSRLP